MPVVEVTTAVGDGSTFEKTICRHEKCIRREGEAVTQTYMFGKNWKIYDWENTTGTPLE